VRAAPCAATGRRVEASRLRSWPIADGDGDEAARRRRLAHWVWGEHCRQQRPHIPRAGLCHIAEALAADPENAALSEGDAALDPRVEGSAVYATSATTKRLQAAKRAATP